MFNRPTEIGDELAEFESDPTSSQDLSEFATVSPADLDAETARVQKLEELTEQYPELSKFIVKPPSSFNTIPFNLKSMTQAERIEAYTNYSRQAFAIAGQLHGLLGFLKRIEKFESCSNGTPSSPGKFLALSQIGSTLNWGIHLGRNYYLSCAKENDWLGEEADILPAIEELERVFSGLFNVSIRFKSKLPQEQQDALLGETKELFTRMKHNVRPEQREVPVIELFHGLNQAVHLQDENLGLHIENVGLSTAELGREYLCRAAVLEPNDFFRLLVSCYGQSGKIDFEKLNDIVNRHYLELQEKVATLVGEVSSDWERVSDEQIAKLKDQWRQALERKEFYKTFLESRPMEEDQVSASEDESCDSLINRPCHPSQSRIALWIKEKLKRKQNQLDNLLKTEEGKEVASEISALQKDINRSKSLLARASMPGFIDSVLDKVASIDCDTQDPDIRALLDFSPQLMAHDEDVRAIDAIFSSRNSDPESFNETLKALYIEDKISEYLGRSLDDGTALNRLWVEISNDIGPVIAEMELGGEMHDYGKIGISKSIFSNNRRLTQEERQSMSRHTVFGAYALEPIASETVCNMPRFHHHFFDGTTNYPSTRFESSLGGRGIPFCARVLHQKDSEMAMLEKRGYRTEHADYTERMLRELTSAELRFGSRDPESQNLYDAIPFLDYSALQIPFKYHPPAITRLGKRKQFDPEIASLSIRELNDGRTLDSSEIANNISELHKYLEMNHEIHSVIETLFRTLLVRNADKAFHAEIAALLAERLFETLPDNHRLWESVDEETERLGVTRSEWVTGLIASILLAELGMITMDENIAKIHLHESHTSYVKHRRGHIFASDRLFSNLGSHGWVKVMRETSLFHHAKPGGRGFYPNVKLAIAKGWPDWATFLESTGCINSRDPDEMPKIPLSGSVHQIIGALTHRITDDGLPPSLALKRLEILNTLWRFSADESPKYDEDILQMVIEAIETDGPSYGLLLQGLPEFKRPKFHAFPLTKHIARTAELTDREMLLEWHGKWIARVAESGHICPETEKSLIEALERLSSELHTSPTAEDAIMNAGLLHDIGKLSTNGVSLNLRLNRRELKENGKQHISRNHNRSGRIILENYLLFDEEPDPNQLTHKSPKIKLDDSVNPAREVCDDQVPQSTIIKLQAILTDLRDSDMSRASKIEIIKLVNCHFIPLSMLIWIQDRAKSIVNDSAPRPTFTMGKLPHSEWEKGSLTWAHTLIELATKGITELPGDMTSKLKPRVARESSTLLRQINSRLSRYSKLLAQIDEYLSTTENLRGELRENSVIPVDEQDDSYIEHPFLDHLLLIWLADMSSKQKDITTRPDINDYLLISNTLVARARSKMTGSAFSEKE